MRTATSVEHGSHEMPRSSAAIGSFTTALTSLNYTCFSCGVGANPRYDIEVKWIFAVDFLGFKPHRIVHNCFNGYYVPENVVILCPECHKKESELFNKKWNKFFDESGKVLAWDKLIEKSFKFHNFYIETYQDTQT